MVERCPTGSQNTEEVKNVRRSGELAALPCNEIYRGTDAIIIVKA